MLGYYIKSTIVFLIIYFAMLRIAKVIVYNRKEIQYTKYAKADSKGAYYTFCFVPILRIIYILVFLWILCAKKEDLDKIFEKKE